MAAGKQQSFPEAFEILNREFSKSKKADCVTNLPQLVVFAEKAVQDDAVDIAIQSVQLYLSMNPPFNQFLIRAHLCLSLSNKPKSTAETTKLQESLRYIAKAVNLAKKTSCYHFLVYNASVILWTVTRPFQVPQHYNLCTNCVQTVVRALDEIGYKDYNWRLQLMRFLVKCQLNSNQKEDATKTGTLAIQMARKHVPEQLISIYKQLLNDGVSDVSDVKVMDKDGKGHPQLSVLSKVWKLQSTVYKKPYLLLEAEGKLSKLLAALTETETTPTRSGGRSVSPPVKPLPPDSLPIVLIEIGEFAMNYSLHHIVTTCLSHVQSIKEPELCVRRELLEIQLMVTDKELYTKQSIKVRCQCVEGCQNLLIRCTRESISNEMERVCVALWNISLPLLQPTLSTNIIKPFIIATSVLEQINSLMYGLRSSLHFELAKIFYKQDKKKSAEDHINKAISLDHHSNNKDCYLHLKQCVKLKADIYSQHHDPLNKALANIEQIKASDITNTHGLYQLLLSIGDTIDNNSFSNILTPATVTTSEPSITEHNLHLRKLSEKAVQYNRYKEEARLLYEANESDNNERRFLILADVAKLARKYHHWDIGILASLYCIQYDNGRWSPPIVPLSKDNSEIKKMESKIAAKKSGTVGSSGSLSSLNTPDHTSSLSLTPLPLPHSPCEIHTERMLLITLAEIHCVMAECLVQTLHDEGIQLGGMAIPPNMVNSDDELWKSYSDWINTLSSDAHSSFVRCAELGAMLSEQWLITNAVVYVWNYHIEQLQQKQLNCIEKPFKDLLQILRTQPIAMRDNSLICRVAGILAGDMIQGSAPKPVDLDIAKKGSEPQKKRSAGGRRTVSRGSVKSKKKGDNAGCQVSPDAIPILKEALEICEFAVECFADTPLDIRRTVLENLVLAKQLIQQPMNIKTIFNEAPHEVNSLITHSQAIISTEMHRTTTNYSVYVFPNIPTIQEVHDLIDNCNWKEHTRMEMELYALLAQSAFIQQNYDGVLLCCGKALKLNPADNSGLLSSCASLNGQCLLTLSEGNSTKIKESLSYFEQSVRYGREAGSYDNVMQSCRHAWNAIMSLSDTTTDRIEIKNLVSSIVTNVLKLIGRKAETSIFSPTNDDYQILMNMITVLTDIYRDSREWESGLESLDHFIKFAPKPLQRMLYEQKVYFKSNLGKSIEGDMLRFQEEPQQVIASLWFICAQHSPDNDQQFTAYQNAIQALQKCDEDYSDKSSLLIQYIIHYSMWLHTCNYPSDIVMEHLKWAVHLVTKDHAHEKDHAQFNATQLDMLLILHVMMLLACDDNMKEKLCLQSVGYCLNIWKDIHTDRQKQQQRNGGMPSSWSDWLTYNLSNETSDLVTTQNSFASDNSSIDYNIPSCHTLKKPMVTLYYLGQLYTVLCRMDHHILCLPILFYQLLLAKNILQDKLMTQLILLRLSEVFGFIVDDSTIPMDYYNKATDGGFIHLDLIAKAQSVSVSGGHVTIASSHVIYDKGCVQDSWIKIADLLIKQGQFQPARDLLQIASNISKRYSDEDSLTTVKLLTAKLASLEKKCENSIEELITLQNDISTIDDWLILLDTLCNIGLTNENSTDPIIGLMKDLLLSNKSCDQHIKSHDQSYLKGVIQSRLLLLMGSNVDDNLEKDVLSNVEQLKLKRWYKLSIKLLHCMIQSRLANSPANADLVTAVEYCRKAIRISQLQQISLPCSLGVPVNKHFILSQLLLCRTLYDIHKQHVDKNKQILDHQQNKSSVQKMIDDYTEEPATLHETLKNIEGMAADEATMILNNILTLVDKNIILKAECLLYIGQFYYSISLDASPDLPLQWTSLPNMDENKLFSSLSMIMRKQQVEHDTVSESLSTDGLILSCNFLMECVSIGLNTKQLDIVGRASLNLLEIFGCCDPLMATSYLALYQSCVASRHCRDLLCTIFKDPDSSRLSALLNQEIVLQSHDCHMTTTADVNLKALQKDYEVYRRLNVSDKHNELMSLLHCDTRVIVLQHSDNKDKLYGGYLIPPQPPIPVSKKGQPPPDKPTISPAVHSMAVSSSDLASIKDLASQYRKDIKMFLQKPSCVQNDEGLIQTSFDDLISSMEVYLEGITAMLMDALKKEDPSKELTVVLLIDKDLMELPLESLSFLQQYKNAIVNLSRDLSLQMLANRIQCMSDSGNDEDAKKKSDKYQPQPISLTVNISSIKYILDPRDDIKLVDNVTKVIQEFSKLTAKWSGFTGTNEIISSGEWYSLITSSSGLLIACSENLLSHYSPRKLASTNLPNCSVALIQDKMSNSISYFTQSKLDSVKSAEDCMLEDSLTAVTLLLLAGLNCVVINQWYSSIADGSADLEKILKDLLSKPTRTGQLHWDRSETPETTYKTFNRVVYGLPHMTFIANT